MTNTIDQVVKLIHETPTLAVVVAAGAGSRTIAKLLATPGASRTVLEAFVPYGKSSMEEFLGYRPSHYVSPDVATHMAGSAYKRALTLTNGEHPVVGLACTATVATDKLKAGEHRCCIATQNAYGVATYDLILSKGERGRLGEEEIVSRLMLWALAKGCGIEPNLSLGLLDTECLHENHIKHKDPIGHLVSLNSTTNQEHEMLTVTVYPNKHVVINTPLKAAVLPGSFSPLHIGHERLAQAASELQGIPTVFELSVVNVDKPPLEETELRARLDQFEGRWPVVLTRAPRFHDKAILLPGCTFVIGWDTLVRVLQPQYYGGDEGVMHKAMDRIREAGCNFLVAGRIQKGIFHTLADAAVPEIYADLFQEIPESLFREDISSSELRAAKER